MPAPHILVVEDENIVSKYIQQALKKLGYEVADASSGKEAIRKAEEMRPDLILMDIVLKGDLDGIETAEQIHLHSDVPVVYLSGYNDQKTLERAKVTEPFGYLQKPFQERDLHTTIQTALYKNLMERRLKEREQWFSTTLKSIGEAVIATDAGERVIYMNPVAEALTGWKQQEGIGRPLTEIFNLIHDETRHKIESPVSRVIRDRAPIGLENHALLITRNGREVPIDDNAAPIQDDQGNLVGAVTVFRDITQRKKSEKALRRSHEGLERKIQERTGELLKVN